MFGTKLFEGVGYPTPTSIPETTTCLILQIPASDAWWSVVTGLLTTLYMEWQWQQFEGGLDRDAAAARWQTMVDQALDIAATTNTCSTSSPTPFWDDTTDLDDEADNDVQPWYGRVTDLDNPTTTFVEDVAIWTFAGFLAVAGAPAAAIAFTTIVPKFVVAIRRGEFGEIIRLYLDGAQAAEIDTSGFAPGDLIEQVVSGDPELPSHDLMIVKVS